MSRNLKSWLTSTAKKTAIGHTLLFQSKKILNRLPQPDYNFPLSVSLEISSLCNLSCIHCPPQNQEFKEFRREYGMMDINIFDRLMDETDQTGVRHIALHKDGEPLLHPEILYILKRVKKNHDHIVYLSTNAHKLTPEIGAAILSNQINTINFSIGAASAGFYEKVRGQGFGKVMTNIHTFLDLTPNYSWRPRVQVQIIDLPEFPEMKAEIRSFKKYWQKYNVEVQVWDKLNWGVLESTKSGIKRYPCFSLWKYLFVNSDGKVSACCMDWKQDLVIGDARKDSLTEIWTGSELKKLRRYHIDREEEKLPICDKCNYWTWLPRLKEYKI